ncbi:MAG: DUF5317 domain-containing protein [Bacillota bacterium]|nr:DUF5317 domain-containing protein [Bacillota bacterium]
MGIIGLAGALLGLVTGLARGGRLGRLLDLEFRWLGLLVAGFLVQNALPLLAGPGVAGGAAMAAANVVAFGLFVAFAAWNLHLPGLVWFLLGSASNLLVIALNGGRMPVVMKPWVHLRPELIEALRGGQDALHVLAGPGTRLPWLADYLALPRIPTPIFSPGDLLIAIGAFLLLERGVRGVGVRTGREGGLST